MKDIQARQDIQELRALVEQLIVLLEANKSIDSAQVVRMCNVVVEGFKDTDIIPRDTDAFGNIYRAKLDA